MGRGRGEREEEEEEEEEEERCWAGGKFAHRLIKDASYSVSSTSIMPGARRQLQRMSAAAAKPLMHRFFSLSRLITL